MPPRTTRQKGIAAKNRLGIPHRVVLALQDDGWIWRDEICWEKRSPMPESVKDRTTKAHEFIFLLTKSPRYFYDAEAIREAATTSDRDIRRAKITGRGDQPGSSAVIGSPNRDRSGGFPQADPDNPTRNARSVWRFSTQPFRGAHFACVDEETECLTNRGWKKHHELEAGMVAAQYDLESGLLSWAPIEDVYRYEVENQEMRRVKSLNLDMLLTPNHRTVVANRQKKTRMFGRPRMVRADELKVSHGIPIGAEWDVAGIEPVSEDWAELIGWYVAEGSMKATSWSVEIYQSRTVNPQKTARIESLLKAVGAHYDIAESTRMYKGEPRTMVAFQVRGFAAAFLRQWAPEKQLHPTVLEWSDRLLRRLFTGLIDGDGHRKKGGALGFVQLDKSVTDMVHAIGFRLGYSAICTKRASTVMASGAAEPYRNRGAWQVHFTRKRFVGLRGTNGTNGVEFGFVPYTGTVWCPKLPKGTFVARRGGRAFITGNTMPSRLAERLIKAGSSEHGVCSDCGAPYKRQVVKTKVYRERPNSLTKRTGEDGTGNFCPNDVAGVKTETVGWSATCKCGAGIRPATILDPFAGAGTTLLAANLLGRNGIGIDLNADYLKMADERIRKARIKAGIDVDPVKFPLIDYIERKREAS